MENTAKLGIGTYGLTGAYGKINFTEYSFSIRYALDAGVRVVDTAASYGDAEALLGIILKDYKHVKVSSKIGEQEIIQTPHPAQNLRIACEKSLKNLNREAFDFYHFNRDPSEGPLDEIIETLEALKTEGKIHTYGIGDMKAKDIQAFCSKGQPSSILFEYSAVSRQNAERVFQQCRGKNLKTIAYGITGRGLLAGVLKEPFLFGEGDVRKELPLFYKDRSESNQAILKAIEGLAKQRGATPSQIAIAWVLSDPRLDYGLMGTSNYLHAMENIRGAQIELQEDELEYLDTTTFYAEKAMIEKEVMLLHKMLEEPIVQRVEGRKRLLYAVQIVTNRQIVEEEKVLLILFDLLKFDQDKHTTEHLEDIREQLQQLINE